MGIIIKNFFVYENKRLFYYDFKYKNKIIEFNGDLFHANPNIYEENQCPNPYKKLLTAKTIWENDSLKINTIKKLGYEVLIIWETDYKKDKQSELLKCLQFLDILYE